MKAVTAEEMRRVDTAAAEVYGIAELVLMENAGAQAAEAAFALLGGQAGSRAAVFAGKGNNGGDAFVAARHLSNRGVKVKTYIVGDAEKISGAARRNLDILLNMDLDVMQVAGEREWDKARVTTALSDVVIDGLLGTGVRGALREDMERVIRLINDAKKPVLSIDLPSGVNADTGAAESGAVRAAATVSFGLPKLGLLLYPGASFAGALKVCDIGLPRALLEDEHIKQNLINTSMVGSMLAKRPPDTHKSRCGKVLIVAGQRGMTGAAALAGEAALRGGAGVVAVAVAASLQDVMAVKLTEAMTRSLPEEKQGGLGAAALPALLAMAEEYDAVVIGPGLGRGAAAQRLAREFVAATDRRLVVDADALHALRELGGSFGRADARPILTPHVGEMAALLGCAAADVERDLIGAARRAAAAFDAVVALKSARTIVAEPNGSVYINTKGNAGMATAGSGDVLAGAIGALCAQNMTPCAAAVSGVYLHAAAGDLAAREGMVGLLAGDIARLLPAARLQVTE